MCLLSTTSFDQCPQSFFAPLLFLLLLPDVLPCHLTSILHLRRVWHNRRCRQLVQCTTAANSRPAVAVNATFPSFTSHPAGGLYISANTTEVGFGVTDCADPQGPRLQLSILPSIWARTLAFGITCLNNAPLAGSTHTIFNSRHQPSPVLPKSTATRMSGKRRSGVRQKETCAARWPCRD